jgi:hypothetical protein
MMRWALITICWLSCLLAWGADGEFRLLYAGNFAACTGEQRAQLAAELAALRERGKADDVPTLLVLPGNICIQDPAVTNGDIAALAFAGSLSPAAVLLGASELKHGTDYLKFRLPQTPLPWLSASAAPRGVSTALFRIVPAGRLRIGIIGLTLAPGELPEKALRDSFAAHIALLRPQCDVLVLLGTFDALQAPILSTLYPQADVVLACTGEREPQSAGRAVIAPAGEQHPYYGQLDLAVREGRLAAWRGWIKRVSGTVTDSAATLEDSENVE